MSYPPSVHYTSRLARLALGGLGAGPLGATPDITSLPNMEDAPSQAEADAYIDELESYMPELPVAVEDLTPQLAYAWTEQAIRNWARENNIPLSDDEIEMAVRGWVEEEYGITVPANVRAARDMGIDIACAAAALWMGIDPRIGIVTYEALSDGEFDEQDCKAIGRVVGSIAGAVIGQAYGIPAPIGAYFGGQFGEMIGQTVAEIFGIGETYEERRAAAREELWEKLQDWHYVTSMRCRYISYDLTHNYKVYYRALTSTWAKLEQSIGLKFQLRWFGTRKYFEGWEFTHWQDPENCWRTGAPDTGYFSSEAQCQQLKHSARDCYQAYGVCTRQGVKCATHERRFIGGETGVYSYTTCWCDAEYGCQYPPFYADPSDEVEISRKVVAALGPNPAELNCELEAPIEAYARDAVMRNDYFARVEQRMRAESDKAYPLHVRYAQVAIDLLRTAAIVQGEKQVSEHRTELAYSGSMDLRGAQARGDYKKRLLNSGVLLLGAGALVWAVGRRMLK